MKTAFPLIIFFLFLGGLVTTVAFRSQGQLVGATHEKVAQERTEYAFVRLTIANFEASQSQLTGTVSVDIHREKPTATEQPIDPKAQLHLSLEKWEGNSFLRQGQTTEPMEFNRKPFDMEAEGKFTWTAHPDRSAFFYPFDRYELYVNPSLIIVPHDDKGGFPIEPIYNISADFTGANFTVQYHGPPSGASDDEDWCRLTIRRPLYLRFVAGVAILLMVVWMVYMLNNAKMAEAGGVLGLFAGVFSLRSSLLSGAPVSPNLIDYISLFIYLYVVMLILWKWITAPTDVLCSFCQSALKPGATACASCGRDVAPHA